MNSKVSDKTRRSEQGDGKEEQQRRLGPWLGLFLVLGAVMDAGIFVTLAPAAQAAGSGILLALVVAGTVALAVGTSGAQLGAAIPVSGGGFTWARHFGLKTTSAVAGNAFVGKEIIVQSVNALTLATFAALLIPQLPTNTVAAGTVAAATALNYFGVKPTARVTAVFTSVVIIVLLIYIVLAAPSVQFARLEPVLGSGAWGVLSAAGLLFFAFAGFERPAVVASTMKDPQRSIPFAIFSAFPISSLLFLLAAAVTLGVLGAQEIAGDRNAVYHAFQQAIGPQWAWIIPVGVIIGTLSTLGDSILGVSQVAQQMGEKGELPRWMGRTSGKKQVPRHAVLLIGGTITIITWFFSLRPLIELANVFALSWYAAVAYSALKLGDEQRFAPRWISWFGLIGCIALLITLAKWAIALGLGLLGALALGRRFFYRDKK
jgi:APA family basic amino acid/polyamine antiporter